MGKLYEEFIQIIQLATLFYYKDHLLAYHACLAQSVFHCEYLL